MSAPSFSALLQRFFTERLLSQLDSSASTVRGYRDTFRLLLRFAGLRLDREPSELCIEELDADFICDFLDHLEGDRGNSARTRNNRLAALRSFFRYAAVSEPAIALQCQRVLAIPAKRFDRQPVEFLVDEEVAALLGTPGDELLIGAGASALLHHLIGCAAPSAATAPARSALNFSTSSSITVPLKKSGFMPVCISTTLA